MANETRARAALVISGVALLPLCVASLCIGASGLGVGELFNALVQRDSQSMAYRIAVYVRLPRMLAAILAGGALACSGLLLQSVLRNQLASPGIIGVNSGAGLCALLAMVYLPSSALTTPIAAFIGALITALAVYGLAQLTGASKSTIVLSGVAVSSLLGAAMDAIVTIVPDAAISRSGFSIGGFSAVNLNQLGFAAPFAIAGMLIALLMQRETSILSLGDESARALGVRVGACRLILISAAALLAGSAVSFAGLLGFVGLIVPHTARILAPRDEQLRLPLCITLGANLCLICDLIARAAFAPYELPVGIVLSFLGAPFFIYLLYSQKRINRHAAA